MRLQQIIEDYVTGPFESKLDRLTPVLADVANKACDEFDWSQTGPDSGACGDVADAMLAVIRSEFESVQHKYISDSGDFLNSDHHTFLLVMLWDERIRVDVPPYIYERWNEEKDLWDRIGIIKPNDVEIEQY
jgi:hypothetical protein